MEYLTVDSIQSWNPGDPALIGMNKPLHSTQIEVFNFTSQCISTSDARGIKIVHSPIGFSHLGFRGQKGVVIRFIDVYGVMAKQNIFDLDEPEYTQDNVFLVKTIESLRKASTIGLGFGAQSTILTLFISELELKKKREIRCDAAGILIAYLANDYRADDFKRAVPDHPLSIRGMLKIQGDRMVELDNRQGMFQHERGQAQTVFTHAMTIIEGNGITYGNLYVRKRGPLVDSKYEVTALAPTPTENCAPGLYVRTNVTSDIPSKEDQTEVTRISNPDEFALYGVYSSIRAAQTPDALKVAEMNAAHQADQLRLTQTRLELEEEKTQQMRLDLDKNKADYLRHMEAAEIKHQHALHAAQRAEIEHQQALKLLEAKAQTATEEAKAFKEKLNYEEQKEKSERKFQKLKMLQEFVKFFPGTVIAVWGLVKFLVNLIIKTPAKV